MFTQREIASAFAGEPVIVFFVGALTGASIICFFMFTQREIASAFAGEPVIVFFVGALTGASIICFFWWLVT